MMGSHECRHDCLDRCVCGGKYATYTTPCVQDCDTIVERQKSCLVETRAGLASIQARIELARVRLARASALTSSLGDERERWATAATATHAAISRAAGDALLSAASATYLGPLDGAARERLVAAWAASCAREALPVSDVPHAWRRLATERDARGWWLHGLPTDDASTVSAAVVAASVRWPFLIDPQKQGAMWVRALEGPRGLAVLSAPLDAAALRTLQAWVGGWAYSTV
jgi:ATP-binding dynein motor region